MVIVFGVRERETVVCFALLKGGDIGLVVMRGGAYICVFIFQVSSCLERHRVVEELNHILITELITGWWNAQERF